MCYARHRGRCYLALVDWTGRAIRDDKRGYIDDRLPSIIHRLNIDADAWQLAMTPRGNVFDRAMGAVESSETACEHAVTILGDRTPTR